MDELLKSLGFDTNGVKYDEMTREERDTLQAWLQTIEKNELTVGSIVQYIQSMKESVENELADTSITSKQDLLLKARLKNYMMLHAFLVAPEKAKKYLESSLSKFKK